ncbi:hypothetical protein O0544_02640 [Edwardsiella anguillarum]|nr:hypothetical protein [Edwardsiella anguillarum]
MKNYITQALTVVYIMVLIAVTIYASLIDADIELFRKDVSGEIKRNHAGGFSVSSKNEWELCNMSYLFV